MKHFIKLHHDKSTPLHDAEDSKKDELSTDYTDRCGNCHSYMGKEDAYCKICGTKRGEGKFEPYYTPCYPIYGPMPVVRVHVCARCGWRWETEKMIDEQKYCPRCGGNAPVRKTLPELSLQRCDNQIWLNLHEFPCEVGRGLQDALPEADISRQHLSLTFQDNQIWVTDLNSRNGTFINGTRIPAGRPYPINERDVIRLGEVELEVVDIFIP